MTSKMPVLSRYFSVTIGRYLERRFLHANITLEHHVVFVKKNYSTEASNAPKEGAEKTQSNADTSDNPDCGLSDIEQLKSEISQLNEKASGFEDKYKRALAETENVRQRMLKQVEDAKQFGIQGFCKDLLTVADTLSMASDNVPKEQLENEAVKSMFDGLKLTESQLLKIFKSHGVNVINPEGEKFDPNFHEALFEQTIPDKEPGTVFVVTKLGYTLNQRVLRPAMVGVVKTS